MAYQDVGTAFDESAPTWADLKWIRDLWNGPIVVKGVLTAEDARALLLLMRLNKTRQLIDDRDGVHIALALRITPSKKAVATENDAVTIRVLFDRLLEHHRQLKSRTLPWNPDQLVPVRAIELLHLLDPVRRRGGCPAARAPRRGARRARPGPAAPRPGLPGTFAAA